MRNIVEIKEVLKTIDKEEILSGINLQIAEGEIYGFLGQLHQVVLKFLGKIYKNTEKKS